MATQPEPLAQEHQAAVEALAEARARLDRLQTQQQVWKVMGMGVLELLRVHAPLAAYPVAPRHASIVATSSSGENGFVR
jgi:hypothetical protein